MKRIDTILGNEKNLGLDFIIHVQNKEELQDLVGVLEAHNFSIQFVPYITTLRDWMFDRAEEDSFDTCFRIRNRQDDKCVAYNSSVDYWKMYCSDILEIVDGELKFVE